MENNMSSSCSWSTDKHESPHQSLWLQTTLSELDNRMKAMMFLLEEDDSSSVEREEIYNNRKSELIQRLGDFNRSYRSLAEQYAHLRSKSHHVLQLGSSSSSSSSYSGKIGYPPSKSQKRVAGSFSNPRLEAFDSQSESVVENRDVECNNVNFHFECLNRLADELMSTESCRIAMKTETEIRDNEKDQENTKFPNEEKMTINGCEISEATTEELLMVSSGRKNSWHELKFCITKLMEENLRQQAELLKRNEDKRKTINGLRAQVERLKSENRVLQNGLTFPKVKGRSNQFHVSRLSGVLYNKFFKAGCS